MNRYFTTAQWIALLRGLPAKAAILDGGSLRTLTGLGEKAGRQACWRLNRAGLLTHLGNGLYTHVFAKPSVDELGHQLLIPSYVSLETVLARRGITTQPCVFHTCVTPRPTQTRETPLGEIHYHGIAPDLFFGFDRKRGPSGCVYLEAWPEKALLDLVYLERRAGRGIWIDLDFGALDGRRLDEAAERFPASVRREVAGLRRTHEVVS